MHLPESLKKPAFLAAFLVLGSCVGPVLLADQEKPSQASAAAGLSHVRAVRLSFIQGTVTMRRPGSADWTAVTVNTPIQEGFSIATTKGSFAEVQFENGSTVRLGEMSSMDFPELALTAQGSRINHLTLDDGYASLNVVPEHHDEYAVSASGVTLTPRGKAQFRADVNPSQLRVEVFDGHLDAEAGAKTEKLGKNRVLAYASSSGGTFEVSSSIQKDEWDKWSEARDQQSALAYDYGALSPDNTMYGWDDLVAYGDWGYFPGFGYAWAPYEPLGWSPYAAGWWGSYPGWGFTWISAEPWGWLPFHYGLWNYSPAFGWFWVPGSLRTWSPALVNWYSGPGWVGWTPAGSPKTVGVAPCGLAVSGCLTAVPPGTIGAPNRPQAPILIHPTSTVGIQPTPRPDPIGGPKAALLAAAPSSRSPAGAGANSFVRGTGAAPSSLLMGRNVHLAATATAPVRVPLGATLGGRLAATPATAASASSAISAANFRGGVGGGSGGGPRMVAAESHGGGFSPGAGGFAPHGGSGFSGGGGASFSGARAGGAGGGGAGGGGGGGGGGGARGGGGGGGGGRH